MQGRDKGRAATSRSRWQHHTWHKDGGMHRSRRDAGGAVAAGEAACNSTNSAAPARHERLGIHSARPAAAPPTRHKGLGHNCCRAGGQAWWTWRTSAGRIWHKNGRVDALATAASTASRCRHGAGAARLLAVSSRFPLPAHRRYTTKRVAGTRQRTQRQSLQNGCCAGNPRLLALCAFRSTHAMSVGERDAAICPKPAPHAPQQPWRGNSAYGLA